MPPLRSRSGHHLLALLALNANREVAREWIAGTLWPDSRDEQALANLRRTLTDLRRALADAASRLTSPTTHTLALQLTEEECDLLAFDKAQEQNRPEAWRQAVALYRGPLLADSYELWVGPERAARHEGYLHTLQRLAQHESEQGQWREAAHFLRLGIACDPLRESLYGALMEALWAGGDVAEAVQVYRTLRLRLHEAFANADPAPEITALYRRLRAETPFRPASPVPSAAEGAVVGPSFLHNLPQRLTAFVGREEERVSVGECLEAARLVTLTGAGGIGKTRLAVAVGEEMGVSFPGGVWLVELAAVTDAALIPNAVAEVLGVREAVGPSVLVTLQGSLGGKRLLLVLDNCEHHVRACASFADALLRECPQVHILATSRQALGITGEVIYPVSGLALPPGALSERDMDKGWLSTLTEYAAIRLFVQRAQAVVPAFRLTAQNSGAVIEICRHLDGIPLAIELAAARLRVLAVAQIAQKLDDCFQLLTGGSRTALPRHQTLQAALDWSYDLLVPAEQSLLQRLGVFAGGATLEEVEAVCEGNVDLSKQALDLVHQLVDKSFVRTEHLEGTVRYRLLETTREYALQKLEASGDAPAIRQRHSDIYADLLEHAPPDMEGASAAVWLNRLAMENDNIRVALEWMLRLEATQTDVQRSQQMILGSLGHLWRTRSYLRELGYWSERVLARNLSPTALRTEVEMLAGYAALRQGEVSVARAHFENAQEAFRTAGNERGALGALCAFGKVAEYLGDHATARDLYARYLSGSHALNDQGGVNTATNNLGNVALLSGDYTAARAYHEACLDSGRKSGFPIGIAWSLDNLAEVCQAEGNLTEARRLFKESLTIFAKIDQRMGIADCLQGLGEVACSGSEDILGARIAARLLGAADGMRALSGIVLPPTELPVHRGAVLQAQQALGEAAFRLEWRIGSDMPLDEAILYATES
jgi:predicted ATPase/DNA-binding SARP family transcriptional activator